MRTSYPLCLVLAACVSNKDVQPAQLPQRAEIAAAPRPGASAADSLPAGSTAASRDASARVSDSGSSCPFRPAPEAERLRPVIEDLLHDFTGSRARVRFAAGGPRKLDDLIVVPVEADLESTTPGDFESYLHPCHLAVFLAGHPNPGIVPKYYDSEVCRRMTTLTEADLNHDGMPDLTFVYTTHHPRTNPNGWREAGVYLSIRSRKTYCFSSAASEAINIDAAFTPSGAVRAVADQVRRLGEERVLVCAKDFLKSP